MIFSDCDIKRLITEGHIRIDPLPDLSAQLGACSLDLRLSNQFSLFNYNKVPFIDIRDSRQTQQVVQQITVEADETFVLQPGAFVLGATIETIDLPDDIVARLEGRSSLGRLGIVVHATASIIDPGWRGRIALELANHGTIPVALYPGMRVCSLTFEPLSTPVEVPYWKKARAKYVDQDGPGPSRIADDLDT